MSVQSSLDRTVATCGKTRENSRRGGKKLGLVLAFEPRDRALQYRFCQRDDRIPLNTIPQKGPLAFGFGLQFGSSRDAVERREISSSNPHLTFDVPPLLFALLDQRRKPLAFESKCLGMGFRE